MKEFVDKLVSKLDQLIEDSYNRAVHRNWRAGVENNTYHAVKDMVNQLVAECGNEWTPCSQGNPTLNDVVKNGCSFFMVTEKYQSTAQRRYYNINKDEWLKEPNGQPIEVFAWKPLPTIYNPKVD